MKIIISPSKTMTINNPVLGTEPLYSKKAHQLNDKLKKFSDLQLKTVFKVSDNLFSQIKEQINNFGDGVQGNAIYSYTGMVFKELHLQKYSSQQIEYLNKNVRILSAYYGILKPIDLIESYRLDFFSKIGFNLYDYFNIKLKDSFIINLASQEFSKLIKEPVYTVFFKEKKGQKYINQATYSKKARGKMLNYLIENKIDNLENLKKFNLNNYCYNKELSSEFEIVFTR